MTKRKFRLHFLVLAFMVLAVSMLFNNAIVSGNETEKVDLRIIGTTDLHGQLNSNDYEQVWIIIMAVWLEF